MAPPWRLPVPNGYLARVFLPDLAKYTTGSFTTEWALEI
jgi:hypothetical protein